MDRGPSRETEQELSGRCADMLTLMACRVCDPEVRGKKKKQAQESSHPRPLLFFFTQCMSTSSWHVASLGRAGADPSPALAPFSLNLA
eukprot:scaffold103301_cov13-Tisochrysis_lutea.AAC.1